ncbi:hypothetical protein HDV00_005811 [Rhizophlyctis rosea]|nr:hypothetical protein HDV00_005811 [Rhizophlyctis rosea]
MVFTDNTYIKHMWAATFVLLVAWALAYLISAFFRGRAPTTNTVGGTGRGGMLDSGSTAPVANKHPVHWRAADAAKKAETLFLMLLAATTYTSFGYGATRATSALAWLFMVLSLLHIAAAFFTRHFAAHLGLGFLSFPLIIAICAMAFRNGFGGL